MTNPCFALAGDSGLAVNTGWAGFLPGGESLLNLELRGRWGRRLAGSLCFSGASSTWENSFEVGISGAGGNVVEQTQVAGGLYGAAAAAEPMKGVLAGIAGFFFFADSSQRYRELGLTGGILLRFRSLDLGASAGFLQPRTYEHGPLVLAGSGSAAARLFSNRLFLSGLLHLQEGESGLFQGVARIWSYKSAGGRIGCDPAGPNLGLMGRWSGGSRRGLIEYFISRSLRHTLSLQIVWP